MVDHNKTCRDTMQGHCFSGTLVHAGLEPCAWTCTALQGTDRAGDAGTLIGMDMTVLLPPCTLG